MISENIDKRIYKNLSEHRAFLIEPFYPRIIKWIKKSDRCGDEFDKYLSLFIATNMFYNLWHKLKHPESKEKYVKDAVKFYSLIELIEFDDFSSIKKDISDFVDILNHDSLSVEIYEKKDNQYQLTGYAQDLLKQYFDDNQNLVKYLLKSLYKIRCNLVHGEKGYEPRQRRLLSQSALLLRQVLIHTMGSLAKKCEYQFDAKIF